MKVFFGALNVSFGFLLPNDLLLTRSGSPTAVLSFCRFSVCRQNDVFFLYFYPVSRWKGFALARATFFRPASKEGKDAPTQQERWLGQTEVFFKSANFDSTLSSQV